MTLFYFIFTFQKGLKNILKVVYNYCQLFKLLPFISQQKNGINVIRSRTFTKSVISKYFPLLIVV